MNKYLKIGVLFIVIALLLKFVSTCNKYRHTNTNTNTTVTKVIHDTLLIKVPIYKPGKTEVKYITKTKHLTDTLAIYQDRFLIDTTVQTSLTYNTYSDCAIKDSITYVGFILSHKQDVQTYPRFDTLKITLPQREVLRVDTVFKTKTQFRTKNQLLVGVNTIYLPTNTNPIKVQPSISLLTKKGRLLSISKDISTKYGGTLNISLPITFKRNDN